MFKKNFWKFLLVDLGFLTLIFFLMVYAKRKVENFFLLFESYQVQMESIEPELMNQTLEGLLQFEVVANELNALVSETYMFVVFLVPITIYLLFCLSQSFNLSLILKKKFNPKFFLKFLILGLPFFVIILFLFDYMFKYIGYFLYSWEYAIYFVLFFIGILLVLYLWFYLFRKIIEGKFRLTWFKSFIYNMNKSGGYYLLTVFFGVITFAFWMVLYVRYITNSFYYLMWIPTLLGGFLFLVVMGYFREIFVNKLS